MQALVSGTAKLAAVEIVRVSQTLGRRVGGSTGTNFVGVLAAAEHMRREGREGSIVTILCDGGERYSHSYYNPAWYLEQGIDTAEADAAIARAVAGETVPDAGWLAQ